MKILFTFKITMDDMESMKTYSRIMKQDSKDLLIKTNEDKNITLVMCDLKFKPYTWKDRTVIPHSNTSTLVLADKSDEHFMFYARKESCRFGSNGRTNVVMPVIVPPITDYDCQIQQVENDYRIQMSAKHYYFTFIIHKIPDHKPIEKEVKIFAMDNAVKAWKIFYPNGYCS